MRRIYVILASVLALSGAVSCTEKQDPGFENAPGMPELTGHSAFSFPILEVRELSGVCLSRDGDFIWGVGDQGALYRIGFDMSAECLMKTGSDWEDVTMDPASGDLLIAKEPNSVELVRAPGYSSAAPLFSIEEASGYGNNGLEGLCWYKDGTVYAGVQKNATLWACRTDGTILWKKQLGTLANGIKEISGLCYDTEGDLLWVIDSTVSRIYVFNGEVTQLLAVYPVSFISNAESVLVDRSRSCVWASDDSHFASRLYRLDFRF